MKTNFDIPLNRIKTGSFKFDYCEKEYGIRGVIPMWVADMDFAVPDIVTEAIMKRAKHPVYGYPLMPDSVWDSVVDWLKQRFGWETDRNWMSLAPGVVPSINLCVQAFSDPGDEVVIQTPVYRPFFTAVENNGRRLVQSSLKYQDSRFVMDYIDLEKKISRRTRFLILCSPHNPTGRVWSREELEKLADICIRKDILVISDEIHFDLVFKGHRHTPLASISREIAERTVTLTAPTKAFNFPGLTTSYVIVSNPDIMSRFKKVLRQNEGLYLGNIFGIAALEAAYRHGRSWLKELVSYLEDNMDFAAEFIDNRIPELTFFKPEGTFLALIDCRRLRLKPSSINGFFLEKSRVLLSDGSVFGDELKGFQRINLGCPRAVVQKALERMDKAIHSSSSSSSVF